MAVSGGKLQVWIASSPNEIAPLVARHYVSSLNSYKINLTLGSGFSKKEKRKNHYKTLAS